ncbi:MAG TPA: O-antigen ligase family protein [Anaerolineae bacterium]|nr:O-antigen ligase family protein [Anaerolineae bacterium]
MNSPLALKRPSGSYSIPSSNRNTARYWYVIVGLVVGLLAAGGIAWLNANGQGIFILPLLLMVPCLVLFLRYPFVGVILWLAVYPFVVKTPGLTGSIGHWGFYRLLIPGMLWVLIMLYWARERPRLAIRLTIADWAMVLFLVLSVGNCLLLSHDVVLGLTRLYDRIFVPFCLFWFVRLLSPSVQDFKRLLPLAFGLLVVEAVVGLMTWVDPSRLPPQWLGAVGERTVGTLGNPAVYSSTLVFLGLLLFQYAMQTKSIWLQGLFVFALALAFFCVFFTFSRGSWLGGALVWVGLMFVYPKPLFRLMMVGLVVMALLSTSVLAAAFAFANERLVTEHTAESRIITDAASLRMINAKPLFGWGYGNYDLYNTDFKEDVGDISSAGNVNTSHNTYLTIAAEQGIPALLLYLFPTAWWFVQSLMASQRLPQDGFYGRKLLILLWFVLLMSFTVSNFMDMIRFNLFGTAIWWLTLALIANLVAPFERVEPRSMSLAQNLAPKKATE